MKITEKDLVKAARTRNWHKLLAKSHPSQTILAHSQAVMDIALTIADTFDLDRTQRKVLMLAAFLHDLGKEFPEFQEGLQKGKTPPHLPTHDQIGEFLSLCEISDDSLINDVFAVVIATHRGIGETVSSLRAEKQVRRGGETSSLIFLGDITKLADWIASANTPEDAYRATKAEDFQPILEQFSIYFEYYSLLKIRGVLTYILHKALQETYNENGLKTLAVFPNGCLFLGRERPDINSLKEQVIERIGTLLKNALLEKTFLESSTAMQINRAMIANEGLVALDSLPVFIEYAESRTASLPQKTDEQKRAIFLRFISTLQDALRRKINLLDIDESEKQKATDELSTLELKILGLDLGKIGLPMSYDFWNGEIDKVSKALQLGGHASRDLLTMPLDSVLTSIKKGYLQLVKEMMSYFSSDEFDPLKSIEIDDYLIQLITDVGHPVLINAKLSNSAGPSPIHAVADQFHKTYLSAKQSAMGSIDGNVRCPICGSAALGTKAIAAGVGSGTKKFVNVGIGTTRLDNINICKLCLLEGILRGAIGYGYVLVPQVSISAERAESLRKKAIYLRRLDRSPEKSVKMFLSGEVVNHAAEIKERLEKLCVADREPFKISDNIMGNYVIMSTSPDRTGLANSEGLAMILLQALTLSLILEVRVKIIEGLDMVDVNELDGAVIFPGNGSLLRTLGLRKGVVDFNDAARIGLKIALAMRARLFADLSKRNGIQQALTTHPGQLAQRILLKREYPRLSEQELMVLTGLKEVDMMGTLVDEIVDILEQYYRPEKYGSSMHSILGPINALYVEFRKTPTLDSERIESIAGRVHRQLQQLNKGDYLYSEAAEPILKVCKDLAERLEKESARSRKKILDDLRYAVYLKRLISINEKFQSKKGGK